MNYPVLLPSPRLIPSCPLLWAPILWSSGTDRKLPYTLAQIMADVGPECARQTRQTCSWWRQNQDAALLSLAPPCLALGLIIDKFPSLQKLDTCGATGRSLARSRQPRLPGASLLALRCGPSLLSQKGRAGVSERCCCCVSSLVRSECGRTSRSSPSCIT